MEKLKKEPSCRRSNIFQIEKMARKEIRRNRLADGDVMLKVQFALAAN